MRTNSITAMLLLLLLLSGAGAVFTQEPDPYQPVRRDPVGTLLVSLASPYPVPERTLEVLFTHRFRQQVDDGDSHNLWGLDGGADIGLGLAAGLTPHLDLSLYRATVGEDFELAAKYLLLEQAPRVPLTVALRSGVDYLRQPGTADSSRPFAQLLLARRLAPGWNLFVSPSWVRDTPKLHNAVNVPVGLTIPLPGGRLIEIEVVPKNRDLDASQLAWQVGFSKALGGHVFELTVGNSRATTVDQALGGDFAGGFQRGDVRLGFNIVRDFRLAKR